MARRSSWAGTVAALVALASTGALSAAALHTHSAGACSTHGLRFPAGGEAARGYRVVSLSARGVPCATARSVASRVAHDLLRGQGISVAGAVGFGLTEESCTGCATTTNVSVSYPHGTIIVSLRGAGAASGGSIPAPSPTLPVPAGPGPVI
jgi:hypothetical protein